MAKRRSIRLKLFLFYLAVAIPFAGLLGLGVYERYQGQLELAYEARKDSGELVATSVASFIQKVAITLDAAGTAIVREDMTPAEANSYLETVQQHYPAVVNVAFVDTSGNIVSSSGSGSERLVGRSIAFRPYFKQIITGKEVSVSDYQQHIHGYYGFVVASGVRDNGKLTGVMIAVLDSTQLGTLFPTPKIGGTNIIDSKGMVIYQNQSPNLPPNLRDWSKYDFVRKALDGKIGRSDNFITPVDNTRRLIVEVPVKEFGWAIGSSIKADDALVPITGDIIRLSSLAFLIFLASSAIAFFIGNRIANPIIELAKKARRLGEEKLNEPIEARTNDEIEDLAQELDTARIKLSSSFNRMGLLLETSSSLNRSLKLDDVATILSASLAQLLNVDRVMIGSFNEANKRITILNKMGALRPAKGEQCHLAELPDAIRRLYDKKKLVIIDSDNPNLTDAELRFLKARRIKSALFYPLLVGDRIIGHIMIDNQNEPRIFSEEDLRLARSIASQAAIAIDNARRYEKEKDIAETLQEALLTVPAQVPGVEISHIYEPAMGTTKVGGDFYDIFELGDDKIGFVIGDVSGKGIEAATITSTAKSTIRAFAYKGASTGVVMTETNHVLTKQLKENQFVTAIFGILDTKTGRLEITHAGHPDMILCDTKECEHHAPHRNPPLGAFANIRFTGTEAQLHPGDTIVLYTDGLIEARRDGEMFGQERVRLMITDLLLESPKLIVNKLIEAAKSFTGENLLDDVALVAMRFKPAK